MMTGRAAIKYAPILAAEPDRDRLEATVDSTFERGSDGGDNELQAMLEERSSHSIDSVRSVYRIQIFQSEALNPNSLTLYTPFNHLFASLLDETST